MLPTAIVLSALLLTILAIQVVWANRFVDLYQVQKPSLPDHDLPKAGVVLSLRGADPYLKDCLTGLLSLDYPNHEIRIIVDSVLDPACEVVDRICSSLPSAHVTVQVLDLRQQSSSLKNSALVQGIQGFSDDCKVFAWLDSDTIPHKNWLRDLVRPLSDENVGAACGIRWFAPPTPSIANYVRHIWNAGALLQMLAWDIGWGGAFAIRKSVILEADLADKWDRTLCEDTVASNAILETGRRMAFVAEATMPNPESASLKWCFNFVTRQLQLLRYSHRSWGTVLGFGLSSGFVLMANLAMVIFAAESQSWTSLTVATTAVAAFAVVSGWLINRSETHVNRLLAERSVGRLSSPIMLAIAAPVTQVLYIAALVRAFFLSKVTWRGIRYEIRSSMDLTRLNYAPYQPVSTRLQKHSI